LESQNFGIETPPTTNPGIFFIGDSMEFGIMGFGILWLHSLLTAVCCYCFHRVMCFLNLLYCMACCILPSYPTS